MGTGVSESARIADYNSGIDGKRRRRLRLSVSDRYERNSVNGGDIGYGSTEASISDTAYNLWNR